MRRSEALVARGWLLGLLLLAASGTQRAADATAPREQGPFTERNQFPFNLLFLAFPARGGAVLPKGSMELVVAEDYANTFSGSEVFTFISPPERIRLTPSSVDAAQAADPGQDLFFVDTEQSRTSVSCRWGATRWIEVDLEIPFLSYRGGFLDSVIEGYHDSVGLGNGSREFYDQDIVQMVLTLGTDRYFADRSPSTFRLGDMALVGRFAILDVPRGAAAVSVGLKIPTGDPERLGGSGSLDEGLEVEGTLRSGRQRVHLSAGWVHTGNWDLFPDFRPADLWSFGASYEYARNARLSWIGQLQTQSSVFRGHEDADASLADTSTEFLAGARWEGAAGRWFFQAAFIENLFNQNNGVDIGGLLAFGVRHPAPKR